MKISSSVAFTDCDIQIFFLIPLGNFFFTYHTGLRLTNWKGEILFQGFIYLYGNFLKHIVNIFRIYPTF